MPQRLGQHFLTDPSVSETIIGALALRERDTVIEVGPGHGALTLPLAKRLAEIPSTRFIAIERDCVLADEIRGALRKRGYAAEVVTGDARTVVPDITRALGVYKLVGNLPYYLTGFFFRLMSELATKPTRAVFMVQREVAERMTATPPRMNLLSATIQHWTAVSLIATVPVSAFSPRPRVEGALVLLEPFSPPRNIPGFYPLVRALFKQPRKTVRNNLVSAASLFGIPPHDIDRTLERIGIDPSGRPQTLSIEVLERFAAQLSTRV